MVRVAHGQEEEEEVPPAAVVELVQSATILVLPFSLSRADDDKVGAVELDIKSTEKILFVLYGILNAGPVVK